MKRRASSCCRMARSRPAPGATTAGATTCGPRSSTSRTPNPDQPEAQMTNELFRSQLASYASVHRDWRNKATHFVGIPIIVFSLLLILSLWRFGVGGRHWTLSLAITIVAVLGWMALDLGIGVVMALIMAVAWYA